MIIVKKNGTPLPSNIKFSTMAPWSGQPKIKTHEIDGADYDILIHTGRKSPSTSISGYCLRTAENTAILEGLKDGSLLEITHTTDGTRTGICTALNQQPTSGGGFITFSMTVVEQEAGE